MYYETVTYHRISAVKLEEIFNKHVGMTPPGDETLMYWAWDMDQRELREIDTQDDDSLYDPEEFRVSISTFVASRGNETDNLHLRGVLNYLVEEGVLPGGKWLVFLKEEDEEEEECEICF